MQFHAAGISWEDPGVTASFAVTEPERTEVVDKNRVIQVGLCFDVLYDRYMADHVDPWIAVAQRMHPLIAKQAEMARLAFLQFRELIVKGTHISKKKSDDAKVMRRTNGVFWQPGSPSGQENLRIF